MAVTIVDGSLLQVASAYGTQFTVTAITNASEAVATLSASHGVAVGDYFELTSGWPLADGRIFRAKTVATNDVTLEGFDTTSTTLYPAGTGTGTGREITTWQSISQVLTLESQGGDQQYWQYQFLDQSLKRQAPTVKDPIKVKMVLADDISAAQVAILKAAEAAGTVRAARLVYRNSSRTLFNGFVAYGAFPILKLGEGVQRAFEIGVTSLPTEYAT